MTSNRNESLRSGGDVDLSIILVNWNSTDYLLECIASVYDRTSDISYEVIVVDNASPAGDVDRLTQRFPAVRLIKSSKNLGFAGANNLGFQHSCGQWILFLNPDTRLVSPAINVMLRQARSLANAGVVGCKLLNSDLSVQTSSIMKFPTILNTVFQMEYLRLRLPTLYGIDPLFSDELNPKKVEAISGACMLMKRDLFEQVGMFSEDYFMYSEDLDLCYKVNRAGLRNYYVGQATIVHHGGKSSEAAWQTIMKTKAEVRFCDRNYGRPYRLLFRLALIMNASARLAIIAVASLIQKLSRDKANVDSISTKLAKWNVTLKTLVNLQSAARLRSPSSN